MTGWENRSHSEENQETSNSTTTQNAEDETVATLIGVDPEVEGILEKLEPDEQETIATMISYSGPLPPPEYLQGYMEVYPESADKIFRWAEEQQIHRRELEKTHLNNAYRYNTTGLYLGFAVVVIFIIISFILIFSDKEIAGFALLTPLLLGVGGLFIKQSKKSHNKDENEEK